MRAQHLSKYFRAVLLLAGLLLFGFSARASNWYVRSGGAGSGSGADWNNASSLSGVPWSSVKPGDTIWLAGGNYSDALSIGASGTAGNYIYIKRVRSTDATPVAAAGWNSSFDSQVVVAPSSTFPCAWNGPNALGSYVYMDGRLDSGISFRLSNLSGASYPGAVYFGQAVSGLSFVTLTNIDIAGPVPSGAITYSGNSYISALSFRGGPYGGSGIFVTDITVTQCRIHGAFDLILLIGVQRALFDHCQFYDCPFDSGPEANHPNIAEWGFSGDITVRYCQWYNWYSEGFKMGDSAGDIQYGPCYMYGNLFFNPNSGLYGARVVEAREGTQTVVFYNNTCVNFFNAAFVFNTVSGGGVWSSSCITRNNIYWNSQLNIPPGNMDYEFTDVAATGTHSIGNGSNPFVNLVNYGSTGGNWQIISNISATLPRNKGVALVNDTGVLPGSLPQTYNIDYNGNVRGADGAWDIGAYEYGSGTNSGWDQ